MKKIALLLAVATMLTSSLGCGSCRNLFASKTHVVARPICSTCAPTQCGANCAPECNSCGTGTPTTSYMNPAGYTGQPMMMTVPTEVTTGDSGQ